LEGAESLKAVIFHHHGITMIIFPVEEKDLGIVKKVWIHNGHLNDG
jgi:hypothetical protein